ncbi:hypothetical protein V1460_25455 [Streptomyces sp. SCSIO 30461]|uniref:hypothetical protein n=1 Tax=Streptomyces sp. SCSIO 30461 TaxID=3118085 RepID=UPI0030D38430
MTAAPLDDATLARATITVGLDRLRELALGGAADTEDTAGALLALHHAATPAAARGTSSPTCSTTSRLA